MAALQGNKSLLVSGVKETGVEIGVGAYGRVFEVEYCGTTCAAKEVHSILLRDTSPSGSLRVKENFLRECQQCADLRHPNVVQFLGVYYRPGTPTPIMLMEKMDESLRNSLERRSQAIPLAFKLSILLDVSLGLRYLHSHKPPIVHRDLSSNNVLLTTFLQAKISDLGVAKVIKPDQKKSLTKVPGTADFMPPEAMYDTTSLKYDAALDVFSFGAVMLHVATQEWPMPLATKTYDTAKRRPTALTEVERRQPYLDKITGVTSSLTPLIISCLDDDPSVRPSIIKVSENIKKAKKEHSPVSLITLLDKAAEQNEALESQIDQKTKEIDRLKKEIDRLQNPGQHHNAAHRTHSNTISTVTQTNPEHPVGVHDPVGVRDKSKSLPAKEVGRGISRLPRWKRIHEYEEVDDDMLDDVDMQNVQQLFQNESTLKEHLPKINVVISDHVSSKSFPRSVQPGHAHEYEEIDDDDDDDVPPDPSPQLQTDFLRVAQSPEMKDAKKSRRKAVLVRRHSSVECERDMLKAKADHEAIGKWSFIPDVMKRIYRPKPKQRPKSANSSKWFRSTSPPVPQHQSPKSRKKSDVTATPPQSSSPNHSMVNLTGTPPLPCKNDHFGESDSKISARDPILDRPPMPTPKR